MAIALVGRVVHQLLELRDTLHNLRMMCRLHCFGVVLMFCLSVLQSLQLLVMLVCLGMCNGSGGCCGLTVRRGGLGMCRNGATAGGTREVR